MGQGLMFRIIRHPFLHPFSSVIRYMELPTNYVKLPFDHALTNHCLLCSFRKWMGRNWCFPILLAAFRKRGGPSQKGWGRLVRTAFLCSHSAGSHTCMLGPHCAFCWQVSKANRFCFFAPMICHWLLVLGRWEKRMTNTDICPPMEVQGGWPKHSSEKEWVGAKTSLHAYALSSRTTSIVWRFYATPQQLCL